jgi:hypothetical protein
MRVVVMDLETLPFSVDRMAPPLVCLQHDDGGPQVVTRKRGALDVAKRLLLDDDVLLVGQNISYDMAVLAAEGLMHEVFRKYRRGQIHCTWVFERLGEISGYSQRKKLDLATVCKAHGIAPPETKGAGLELGFGQFIDADEIPEPYLGYALGDLVVRKIYERQTARFKDVPVRALDRLTYRQYVLQLMSIWGMVVDPGAVDALERDAAAELDQLRPLAQEWGFIRADGTRNMKAIRAAVEESYGSRTPRTPTGQASTAGLVLEQADSPKLQAFKSYGEWLKTLTNDVPNLRASGSNRITTRYGLADTLRTTSGGDRKGSRTGCIAMQNLRQGAGIRECIRPRQGMAFYDADASGLELCSLAQICVSQLGRRGMADAIRAAGTPGVIHTRVAATMARQSEAAFAARLAAKDPAAIGIRTRAKNAVFGYMGGLGAQTFVDYVKGASKGKIVLTLAESQQIKADLFAAIPDIQAYLRWVGAQDLGDGEYDAEIAYGVTRRGIWYAAAANNRFQSLAAAAMTEVVIALAEACYIGALAPCRPCLFVHDEVLVEVPEECVHEFDVAFDKLARDATLTVMPDVPTIWEAEAGDRFSKQAKRVVRDGRLQVWRGEKQ